MKRTLAAALLAATAAWPAAAQQPEPPRIADACRTDLAAHCAGIERGKGGRAECLRQNEAKLSPGCASALKWAQQLRETARTACRDDRVRFCKGVRVGGGSVMACLREKQAELSKPCADAIASLPVPRDRK